jgi:hypothetical protein
MAIKIAIAGAGDVAKNIVEETRKEGKHLSNIISYIFTINTCTAT